MRSSAHQELELEGRQYQSKELTYGKGLLASRVFSQQLHSFLPQSFFDRSAVLELRGRVFQVQRTWSLCPQWPQGSRLLLRCLSPGSTGCILSGLGSVEVPNWGSKWEGSWISSSSSSQRFSQENREMQAKGIKLPAGRVEAGRKEERTGSHGCHSHRCVQPLPRLILLRILPLFSRGPEKSQNEEVLTHRA